MQKNLKIIFFGTPDFAVPVLDALIAHNYVLLAVVTQPDKKTGRKKILSPSAIKVYADKNNILVLQPNILKEIGFFEEFLTLKPDMAVIAGYGKIIPEKYLKVPKYGFLCVHPSLLPKYRGPSPIQNAILNGDKETGVSILLVDKEIDHGPILSVEKYKLEPTATFREVEKKIWGLGTQLLIETIPKYIDGAIKPKEQNHSQATFTKLLVRENGRINWNQPCDKIYNQIRALNPEPGTWTVWKNKVVNISNVMTFKVINPQMADLTLEMPGTVKRMGADIVIVTGTGYLILKSLQIEGGKVTDAKSFINGHPDFLGSQLE